MNYHRIVIVISAALLLASCGPGGRFIVKPQFYKLSSPLTGTWDSSWGVMVLKHSGKSITGTYRRHRGTRGTIAGKLRGNLLEFRWVEQGDLSQGRQTRRGGGYFLVSRNGNKLTGRWGYGDSISDGGVWTATRGETYD